MNMTPGNPASLSYLFQLVFGLYMLVTTVVLINLLIAMMSDTYQRIQVKRACSHDLKYFKMSCSSNNQMWNGSLVWLNWSDRCTEQTCHPHQLTLWPLGLCTSSEFVGEVEAWVNVQCSNVPFLKGNKSKVDDYSRLQESSSAKSGGMFKKSIVTQQIGLFLKIFASWKWPECTRLCQHCAGINFKLQGPN